MKKLKAVMCFIGKWTWNGIIGIIFLALAVSCAVVTVFGQMGAKLFVIIGGLCIFIALFAGGILWLVSLPYADLMRTFIIDGLIFIFGPGFVVGIASEILKSLTLAVKNHCFIE